MLKISQADYELMRGEAEHRYPLECCGVLLGSALDGRRTVSLTIACDNQQSEPRRRYSIAPEQLIAIQKLARTRHENIIGFYHSHPDQGPRFSPTDLAEAHWFDCSYVITGVSQGRAAKTESFVLTGSEEKKNFEAEEIQIGSDRSKV
jgi:proteasome lid subunit RPN8/RPN11